MPELITNSLHGHIYSAIGIFNANPLVPPGTKVVFHNKPEIRSTWDMRGQVGYYISPAVDHYRCVKIYKPDTRKEIVTDTIKFVPHTIPIPSVNADDILIKKCSDIKNILQQRDNHPILSIEQSTKDIIKQVATTLHQKCKLKKPEQSSTPTSTQKAKRIEPKLPRVHNEDKANPSRRIGTPRLSRYPHTSFNNLRQLHLQLATLTNPHSFRPKQLKNYLLAHIFDEKTGTRESIDSLLKKDFHTWNKSLSNEWGRLAQGNENGVKGTDTIEFIPQQQVPTNAKVTYASFVCDHRPLKPEPFRVRIVVGGDKLEYQFDAGSPAASLLETKLLLNSTISDSKNGARFFTADVKDFFLATPMKDPEYMRVPFKYFPKDIVTKYNLHTIVSSNNFIYIKIKKGMYGLKQAAVLAYQQLVKNLANEGYYPVDITNGIWRHVSRRTRFCLCVDDFGVKSFSKEDTDHFINSLRKYYNISLDMSGNDYCGLHINWDYKNYTVDISMPNYVKKLLQKIKHKYKKFPQHAPHQWTIPAYGKKRQFATENDNLPILNKKGIKFVQSIVGSLLYYARAIDFTMLPALNEIAARQANPTSKTLDKCQMLLDYANTYPNSIVRFHASDMILHVDSDAAYLVQEKARSRISGSYKLSSTPPQIPFIPSPKHNAPILTECKTLRHVVASAAEAETGGLFHNAQTIIPIRSALQALDHPQPPTPLKTDNSTAHSFVHNNMRQKKSKSWDMRFNWLRDKELQKIIRVYWRKGSENEADYTTKHFPPDYHKKIRKKYFLNSILLQLCSQFQKTHGLQGCVEERISTSLRTDRE